jgi:hypothetical protein
MDNHCEELRALFKEYVRPVHHEISTEKRRSNMPSQFDITREFPIVFGCVFSRELTSAHYVCDPVDNGSSKQPRGALVFADKPFPERVSNIQERWGLIGIQLPEKYKENLAVSRFVGKLVVRYLATSWLVSELYLKTRCLIITKCSSWEPCTCTINIYNSYDVYKG